MRRLGKKHLLAQALTISLLLGILGCSNSDQKLRQLRDQLHFSGENQVKIRVRYIGCVCGLDYPQYNVDSVLYTDIEQYDYLINKEISLTFKDSTLEHRLTNIECPSRCFRLLLSGNLESNELGMHNLAVESGNVVKKDSCCNSSLRNRTPFRSIYQSTTTWTSKFKLSFGSSRILPCFPTPNGTKFEPFVG